jgi:hypothetical protein
LSIVPLRKACVAVKLGQNDQPWIEHTVYLSRGVLAERNFLA